MAEESKPNEKPAAGGEKEGHAAPAKPAGPAAEPWESDLVASLRQQFGSGIREASTYLGQNYVIVGSDVIEDVLLMLRDEDQFDYCVDITAVHYPERQEQEFEVVYILYSFPRNERIRVKTQIADGRAVPSAVPIWPTANWLEREVFRHVRHPFRRPSGPETHSAARGWKGYPLRKDYAIHPAGQRVGADQPGHRERPMSDVIDSDKNSEELTQRLARELDL